MNRFNYVLYTVILGLLGSGLTAQAMKRGAGRILSPVLHASKIAKNSNVAHFAKEFGTEGVKGGYQQVSKRVARGGVKALVTGVHTKSSSILSENKNKSFKKTKKSTPIISIDDVTGKVRFNDDSQPSEKKWVTLTNNASKDQTKEKKESGIANTTETNNKADDLNVSEVVSRVFSSKTQQPAESKQIISAGKTEAQSQDVLKVEARKLEQKIKQPKKETKKEKEITKLEEKKKKDAEKAVERRKKDDEKFVKEQAKAAARKAKIDAGLKSKFDKQLQLRKDQEVRAEQRRLKAQQKLEQKLEKPQTNSNENSIVPIRNQNSDSATQLVRSEDSMSLVEIEKLLTDEVVVNITTDNPVARLKQLDAIYGDTLNNQLAVRNTTKNQPLMLKQTSKGEIKQAVLLVPTKQLKDILGNYGVRLNGGKSTQIIISPTQARNALDAITRPKQPALPEAKGKDLAPVTPRNNKIIDVPVAEKPQELSVTPISKNTITVPRRTVVSAGKANGGVNNATLSVQPTPVTRALIPVSKPSRALVPKRVQPTRGKLVVAQKARAEVDSAGLKAEAEKIDIPEQKRFEQEEVTRERERFERERDEQRREEEQRNRDKEREEEQKEQERLERERREKEEQKRREEEQRRNRDREREEIEKEISKRDKRARRGDKQRADQAKYPVGRQIRAQRGVAGIPSDQVVVIPHPPYQPQFPIVVRGNPIVDDNEPRPIVPGYFPAKNQQDPRVADYLNILAVARTPTAQLIQNPSIRMDLRWAHAEDPGIAAMLNAFNGCVKIIVENSKDAQLADNDIRRKCDLPVMMQSAAYFETIKAKIANEMVHLLATMGVQA